MELGPEDVSLLEKYPHFRGCHVQTSIGHWFSICTHCDLMVNAALVMEAGRLSSFATARHAFFLITCVRKGRGREGGRG